MTSNQINYVNYVENSRHNKESERQGRVNLSENKRHNRATEDIGRANVDVGWGNVGASYARAAAAQSSANAAMAGVSENARHNKEMESLTGYDYNTKRYSQEEQARHNVINETVDQAKLSPLKLGQYGALKTGKYFGHLLSNPNEAQEFVNNRTKTYKGGQNGKK